MSHWTENQARPSYPETVPVQTPASAVSTLRTDYERQIMELEENIRARDVKIADLEKQIEDVYDCCRSEGDNFKPVTGVTGMKR